MSYDPNSATPRQFDGGQLRARRFGARLTPSSQEGNVSEEWGPAQQSFSSQAGPWAAPTPQATPPWQQPANQFPADLSQSLKGQPGPWDADVSMPYAPFAPSQVDKPAYTLPDSPRISPEASTPIFPPPGDPVWSQKPQRRKKRKSLLLLIVLLAVILLGGLSYFIYSFTRSSLPTRGDNASTSTATVEVNKQATALTAGYPFSKDLALNDVLNDNSQKHGWMEDRYCKFHDKSYEVRDPEKSSYYTCPALKTNFTNFTYEVKMRITQGEMAGITFRGDDVKYKYYAFVLNSDGSYALLLYTGRDASPQPLTTGTIPQFQAHDENQVGVTAQGSTIRLFINHQLLGSVENSALKQGQIGMVVFTQKGETTASYRDAKVWNIS